MSIENGREHFRALGIEDRVLEFDVSSATVPLAAKALGVEHGKIAKPFLLRVPKVRFSWFWLPEMLKLITRNSGRHLNAKPKC